jgi:hypothetical protein
MTLTGLHPWASNYVLEELLDFCFDLREGIPDANLLGIFNAVGSTTRDIAVGATTTLVRKAASATVSTGVYVAKVTTSTLTEIIADNVIKLLPSTKTVLTTLILGGGTIILATDKPITLPYEYSDYSTGNVEFKAKRQVKFHLGRRDERRIEGFIDVDERYAELEHQIRVARLMYEIKCEKVRKKISFWTNQLERWRKLGYDETDDDIIETRERIETLEGDEQELLFEKLELEREENEQRQDLRMQLYGSNMPRVERNRRCPQSNPGSIVRIKHTFKTGWFTKTQIDLDLCEQHRQSVVLTIQNGGTAEDGMMSARNVSSVDLPGDVHTILNVNLKIYAKAYYKWWQHNHA